MWFSERAHRGVGGGDDARGPEDGLQTRDGLEVRVGPRVLVGGQLHARPVRRDETHRCELHLQTALRVRFTRRGRYSYEYLRLLILVIETAG